jgi:hypothetical protein
MLFFHLLLLITIFPVTLLAQDISDADTVDMGFLLRREKSANVMLHTLGYGFGYRIGYNKTFYKNRMLEFDLLEMRAPNQIKRYNDNFPNPRGYFYGKLNYLYILRTGIGRQYLVNRKPYWGGVEVRAFAYGGLDVGFARPSYLYIAYYKVDPINNQYYVDRIALERYDPDKHFPNPVSLVNNFDIYGRGPILSGFDHIKLYPGLYLKGGFNFEFSSQNDKIQALEIGGTVDIFPKAVPVMAFRDPNLFFITGYLSFHFGKRYN